MIPAIHPSWLKSFTTLLVILAMTSGSCRKEKDDASESLVKVRIDSNYYAMNPMDLEFDSLEMVMIDSGMAGLIDAYREIRA